MAKKSINYDSLKPEDAPATLEGHPFYGLLCDDEKQNAFKEAIWNKKNRIIFVNACAGSGKTTVATATACLLVAYKLYSNIYYCVTSCHDKQGFLPGTIEDKSDPYFVPFYQALSKIGIQPCCINNNMENIKNGTAYISCITDTYLRGMTFEDSVVIFDEAQNMTTRQLRTAITRCSDNCKIICAGSHLQIDIENSNDSGFLKCIEHFRPKEGEWAEICELTKNYRGEVSAWADLLRD